MRTAEVNFLLPARCIPSTVGPIFYGMLSHLRMKFPVVRFAATRCLEDHAAAPARNLFQTLNSDTSPSAAISAIMQSIPVDDASPLGAPRAALGSRVGVGRKKPDDTSRSKTDASIRDAVMRSFDEIEWSATSGQGQVFKAMVLVLDAPVECLLNTWLFTSSISQQFKSTTTALLVVPVQIWVRSFTFFVAILFEAHFYLSE